MTGGLYDEVEYFNGEPNGAVRVRVNAKLIKQPEKSIVASKNFERLVDVKSDDVSAVVDAFDEALGGVLKRLIAWSLQVPS